MTIGLRTIAIPDFGDLGEQPRIPAETYAARCAGLVQKAGCDWVVVYADREHFANILHLTGFEPRFEEALLLLDRDGRRILVVGNECEPYTAIAGLPDIEVFLCQTFSLMAQDRSRKPNLANVLAEIGLKPGDSIGLAGWKYLEIEEWSDSFPSFFVPALAVDSLRRVIGRDGALVDATALLMHPETGQRAAIDADQIAAFEWASARGSAALWRIVSGARVGDSEFVAAARMGYAGDPFNCHTMLASGSPGETILGLRSPTARLMKAGDGVTTAIGLSGGLSSRAGLLSDGDDAFLVQAKAYFKGLIAWYETADIGVSGGEIFAAVTQTLAEGGLRSALNPGHLTGHDEWMHSPIRPGSTEKLRSGMPFQVDIIPVPMPAGSALNCEDGLFFADAGLRAALNRNHPNTYQRMMARRAFVQDVLGIPLKDSMLPVSSIPLCLPPFWLKPDSLLCRT